MNRTFAISLLFASSALATGCAQPPRPDPIVAQQVRIDRDAMGVPHVFGKTSAAVMFGAGYAEAQDRLADMETFRRRALGRTAEILGASAVQSDIISLDRKLDSAELMRMYRAIPPEHQRMMQAYVDGINRVIDEIDRDPEHKTPYEFTRWGVKPEHWTLLDFLSMAAGFPRDRGGFELQNLAFYNAMVTRYGETKGREIFDDVVPVSDPDSPTAIPAGDDLAPVRPLPKATYLTLASTQEGIPPTAAPAPSNNHSRCLVIGPQRSASGKVLMLESTADGPEIHLHGGGFDSAGFTMPSWGIPIMGRGPNHGWLVTSGQEDTTDTFAERLNPLDPHQYWYQGKWQQMDVHNETIVVKGAAPVDHEVARTIHGTVVSWDKAHGVAYTQRFAERGHELDNWVAVVEMQRAHTLADFESKGIARLSTDFGVCYGDDTGQIGFWETGLQPKRAPGADPRLPTPGTGDYEWQGFLSLAERPHMLNPKQGYIHSWNSKATTWSREGDEGRFGATFRTWLGNRLGASSSSTTLLDMEDYNGQIWNAFGARDRTLTSPDFFAPFLKAAAAEAHDAQISQAVDLMVSWNGLYQDRDGDGYYDNPGLTLFRTWLEVAPKMIFDHAIGNTWKTIDDDRYLKYQTSLLYRTLQGPQAGLPVKFDYFDGRPRDAVVADTIRQTIELTRKKFPGRPMEAWRMPIYWKYFTDAADDPARPSLPDDDERSSTTWAELGLGPKMVPLNGGEEWTGLMELGGGHPVLYTVTEAGGQNQFIDPSGHGTPHLTDQVQMHAQNHLKPIDLGPEDSQRNIRSSVTLEYGGAGSTLP
ncbi:MULTISPECIES: penicillin acylase family protein [Paraburkholderia]|uniref:penicillin acylase family protein n=1 Tax=Paraburkholderia TaxID=1822464 RepID=UPI00224EE7A8|nr:MULTISPECIES: penicillin acylase family protein [Paraburkholderia]MCX4164471.1 penicillin acylase family protein [Paraburkholderia megapolitana]MDN7159964.1 penicillin acylase family protein [Paraburkholderia sp. CHISQ3]MDQ6497011.1 penicillin acylase family protein [Paraburkholderia megapolitana]